MVLMEMAGSTVASCGPKGWVAQRTWANQGSLPGAGEVRQVAMSRRSV